MFLCCVIKEFRANFDYPNNIRSLSRNRSVKFERVI